MHNLKRLELLMEVIPIRFDIYIEQKSIIAKKIVKRKGKQENYF